MKVAAAEHLSERAIEKRMECPMLPETISSYQAPCPAIRLCFDDLMMRKSFPELTAKIPELTAVIP